MRLKAYLCAVFFLFSFSCYKAAKSDNDQSTGSKPGTGSTSVVVPAPIPTSNVISGTYTQPQNVILSTSLSSGKICYTISGSGTNPACDANQNCVIGNSVASGWTVQVSNGVLRAVACAAGYTSSSILSLTIALDQIAPNNVSGFSATPNNNQVQLNWFNPGSDFSGVRIVRKAGSAPLTPTDGAVVYTGTANSYLDTTVTNGTTYYFAAFSFDAANNYSAGTSLSVTPYDAPPNNVSVWSVSALSGQVSMSWTNPVSDFAGVRVVRRTGGNPTGPFDGTVVYQGTASSYTDTSVVNGFTYYYGFYSYDASSNYASGVFSTAAPSIAAPFLYSFVAGNGLITFSTQASGTSNSTGLRIMRKAGSAPSGPFDGTVFYSGAATPYSNLGHTDSGVSNGTMYYYAAYAYDAASNYSSASQQSGTPRIPAVTGFSATAGYNQISLSWTNPVAGNLASVKVLRKTTGFPANASDGSVLYQGSGNTTSDINLPSGVLVYYAIYAIDSGGANSVGLFQTSTPTALQDATGVTANAGANQITLNWTNSALPNFSGVKIVRKTGSYPANPTDGTTIYTGTGTSYADTSLPSGVLQYYRIYSTDCCTGLSPGASITASPSAIPEISGLTLTPGARSIAFSWANPVATQFAGTRIVTKVGSYPTNSTDGTILYNGSSTTYTHTNIENDKVQYYRVFTYDNFSAFSSGTIATSAAAPPNEIVTGWNKNLYVSGLSPSDMKIDSAGNVYVIGSGSSLVSGGSGIDWYIRKFDSSGTEDTVNWNKKFSSASNLTDWGIALAIDTNNNVYALGTQNGTNSWWIKKFSPSGTEDTTNWNKIITSISGWPRAMVTDALGNLYAVGQGLNRVAVNSYNDWVIKKYSPTGVEDMAWNKAISWSSGSGDDGAEGIAIDPTGYVYVVGYGDNSVTTSSRGDWWIKKFDFAGNEIATNWDKRFSSGDFYWEHAKAVLVDGSGNVYVSGYWNENSSGNNEQWLIKKFAPDGTEDTVNWNKFFPATTSGTALAADSAGNIYAVGTVLYYFNSGSYEDWYLKKFSSAGVEDLLSWDRKFNPSLIGDPIYAVALDPAGKIYVAGNYLKKFNP